MNQDAVTSLLVDMMGIAIKVGMPLLLSALVVGLLISIFQAATQIQEQTLSFIPKIAALVVVLMVAGPWMLTEITDWTSNLWGDIAQTVDFKPVGGDDGP